MSIKKCITSVVLSALLALQVALTVSAQEPQNQSENGSGEQINIADAITFADSSENVGFGESIDGNTLKYLPRTRAVFTGSSLMKKSGELTANDAIDFYTFSVSSGRILILNFTSPNADYIAAVCPYNPSTGDVNVNLDYSCRANKGPLAYSDFNRNGQNNYCLIVANLSETGTGQTYSLQMNATNSAPTSYQTPKFLRSSSDLQDVWVNYKSGSSFSKLERNGEVKFSSLDFDNMQNLYYKRTWIPSNAAYSQTTVNVASEGNPIKVDSSTEFYFGTYTTNTNGPGPSSNYSATNALIMNIPVDTIITGYRTGMGQVISQRISAQDFANKSHFLIFDLDSNPCRPIDCASSLNIFYTKIMGDKYSISNVYQLQ